MGINEHKEVYEAESLADFTSVEIRNWLQIDVCVSILALNLDEDVCNLIYSK